MKIEVGKRYRTRGGEVVEIIGFDDSECHFPVQGRFRGFITMEGSEFERWSSSGLFASNALEHPNDLVGLIEDEPSVAPDTPQDDPVNSPSHYTQYPGIEIIDLTQHMNFCRGNAVKYLARAGVKDPSKELEDLNKARWYVEREIKRLEASNE